MGCATIFFTVGGAIYLVHELVLGQANLGTLMAVGCIILFGIFTDAYKRRPR